MTYKDKYQELVELSRSDNPMIREQADAWLVSIGLQDAAELKVSAYLLDLVISNVKGEISRDGGYEILPPDSPKIKEIEEYNRKLRPTFYAELDKKRNRRKLE